MRKFLLAAGLAMTCAAFAAPAQATVTWQGTSTTVINNDGDSEQYTVTFTLNDNAAAYVFNNYATVPQPGYPIEFYDWALYNNIESFSIVGPRFNLTFDGSNGAYTRVSTLRYERMQGGITGFSAHGGSEGFTEGYAFDFNYWLQNGFADTSLPTSLDIPGAYEAGFTLQYFSPIEESEEFEYSEAVNFRFVSGGFLPAATAAVPEPATWAMLLAGFGLVGGTMRRRRRAVPAIA